MWAESFFRGEFAFAGNGNGVDAMVLSNADRDALQPDVGSGFHIDRVFEGIFELSYVPWLLVVAEHYFYFRGEIQDRVVKQLVVFCQKVIH
ncbi:hypothetical protein AN963_08355 [Brevibacillus choshinensis]|uniref:Uncharacterized protein n=1 Tax=Brevibacillus choshinensis TaxID=54911 RepID=A0ABR5NDU8_BRECH|nr:hypothetical protein [Brevibacillus choshinensis]KQL49719.1 hypothetical protein AN963_08355 [Brevibacillus choshinensis]